MVITIQSRTRINELQSPVLQQYPLRFDTNVIVSLKLSYNTCRHYYSCYGLMNVSGSFPVFKLKTIGRM